MSRGIGLLGGTFDPVHIGHLQSALEVRDELDLASVRLIPAFVPPHREQPGCSAEHRLAMVARAVESVAGLEVDDREIVRGGASYTYDTLRSIRAEIGEQPLVTIMGMDSFLTLGSWHRWTEILDCTHIVVLDRPGAEWHPDPDLAAHLEGRITDDAARLASCSNGAVARLATTQLSVSATTIRAWIGSGRDPGYLVPEAVKRYIADHGIYRR